MREILFRGKTKVYNKWVYGWHCGKILNHDMHSTEESSQIIDDKTLYWHTCEPDTVGQFTGLTDKNGKKIFDGDVVKIQIADGSFRNASIDFRNGYFTNSLSTYLGGLVVIAPDCEVIGNIHDNPELLENP